MNTFQEVYEWSEREIWNTLTKKLMSFLFLFMIDLFYLFTYFKVRHDIQDTLSSNGVSDLATTSVMADLNFGLKILLVLTVIALVWNILQILYMRHLIVHPVKTITGIFEEISKGEGNFSRDLPLTTHDEFRQLAESYNLFANKMRQIIGEVRNVSVSIARDAVLVNVNLDETATNVHQQAKLTDSVFVASNEATKAIDEVSRSTQIIANSTNVNLEQARVSLQEMQDITERINSVGEKVLHFNHTVDDLWHRSESVNQFATVIRKVADQTNLLALNAAIEAARAGEAGRGFAVVADEVRKLADSVNKAATEITGNVAAMLSQVKSTRTENDEINIDVQHTRDVVGRSSAQFRKMVGDFELTGEQLLQIAAAMEQLSATNAQVHENVGSIHDLSARVSGHMTDSSKRTAVLSQSTEGIQELVSRFNIGVGIFEEVVGKTRIFRDKLKAELEAMAHSGQDIFDKNYAPIGKRKPQKYRVSWGEEYTRRCQSLLEDALRLIPGCIYAVGVNTDGYLSSHNLKFSKPLTGDDAVDIVGNRCNRKFDAPGELRAAKNTNPVLLRTYRRDTGEVLCDIAMPIEIDGRLWGNVRVGITAENLVSVN
ncbi:methyl-accepting chemotaxis protein [Sideroxydans sp. CL21]|uniref:methyl-accepting chemotaxis protein n=1 Tax=Sideroxydans sp. CL21 TaxID=2600596 RepID=UPI0024BC9316|nr:methyl-accepting chemotaxis protein [Sideroxydans sp. CL21]